MKIFPIQSNFSSGELSDRMVNRHDDVKFPSGLKRCVNFIPTPQGMLQRRKGTQHMYEFATALNGRIFPMRVNDDLQFAFVMTDDGKLRAFTKSGLHTNPALPDDIILDAPNWDKTALNFRHYHIDTSSYQAETGTSSTLVTKGPNAGIFFCSQQNESYYDHSVIEIDITPGRLNDDVHMEANISSIVNANDFFNNIVIKAGSTADDDDLGSITIPIETGPWVFDFNPGGNALVYISFAWENVNFGCLLPLVTYDDMFIEQKSLSSGGVEVDHEYRPEDIDDIQYSSHPSMNRLYLTHPKFQPWIIDYDVSLELFEFFGAIDSAFVTEAILNPPPDWSIPVALGVPPPADANFPISSAFHQGRLWFGGTPEQPQGLYSSAADGNYDEFETPDQTTAATAITIYIAARAIIKWIASSDSLLVGTDIGIYVPESSTDLLQTADITANFKTGYGVNKARPVFASSRPIYASSNGIKVRDLLFTEEGQEFLTKEITFEHGNITSGGPIVDMVFDVENDSSILCLSGAQIVQCLYNKHLDKIGWARMNYADPILAMACMCDQTSDVNFYLSLTSTGKLHLIWDNDTLLDDSIRLFNPVADDAVSAPHLADRTISVLADGERLDNITLDGSGDGTISTPANEIYLGHEFISLLETMPKNILLSIVQNTYASLKNWSKIYISLLNSTNPTIQGLKTADELTDGATGAPIASTKRLMQLDDGWDDEGTIIITQSEPFPCNILAIHGEMSEEN
jgi:hypothetical protein